MASMTIALNNISKRFNYEWILKNISFTFRSGTSYAILGPNGSGKSTLLQMISGSITPSSGDIIYKNESGVISADDIFHYLAIATPYLELVEELTFDEHLVFQQQFKPFYQNRSLKDIASITGLDKSREKQIRNFSNLSPGIMLHG